MTMHLLPHIDEMLTTHRIISHYYPTSFFPRLVGEKCSFLSQVLTPLGLFWQHHLESGINIVNCILSYSELFFWDFPF
jgi:hypothetical protein